MPERRVLFVCTGNICRSPFAERLLEARLGEHSPVRAASAGTRAMVGGTMTAHTRELVLANDGRADGFRARQLDGRMLAEADLVLGLTQDHCLAALDHTPAIFARTFTLLEFAQALSVATPPASSRDFGGWDETVARCHRARNEIVAAGIADPYGRDVAAYEAMAADVVPAVEAVAEWVNAA